MVGLSIAAVLGGLSVVLAWYLMDKAYTKYANHEDYHLWQRSNEQILAEIQAVEQKEMD